MRRRILALAAGGLVLPLGLACRGRSLTAPSSANARSLASNQVVSCFVDAMKSTRSVK